MLNGPRTLFAQVPNVINDPNTLNYKLTSKICPIASKSAIIFVAY